MLDASFTQTPSAMKIHHALLACLLSTVACLTPAQTAFPTKPIRVVIGFPAGGPLDQHARLLSERLQQVRIFTVQQPRKSSA